MGTESKALSPAYRVRRFAIALSELPLGRLVATRLRAAWLDIAIVLGLTVIAAVPRLVLLTEIPPGLHGDEAWTGLDARRVLNEGWIGPDVGRALGQPSGPLYFAAPIVGILGDSVFSVRLSMALLAIVTIPVAYLTFSAMFNRTFGVFAALLLAFGLWHLHYSRIAFMVISWPLMELLTLLFLFLGLKTGRWIYYGLSGMAFGFGLFTYNAYPVFAVPMVALIVWLLLQRRSELPAFGARIALMLVVAVIAALPMILYAADPDNGFLNHHRSVSLLERPEWEDSGLGGKADLVFDRTRNFYVSAYWEGEPDGADGAGERAMVDRITVILLVLGAATMVWRWRRPGAIAVLLMVLLLPFASVVSIDAMLRRTVGIVPFVAALAAAPLALLWDQAKRMENPWRNISYAGVAVVVAAVGYLNLDYYFGEFRDTPLARFVFAHELADASSYIDELPGEPYVYLYSGRWGFNYETRLYIAGDLQGEDRSQEFGEFSLEADRSRDVVFVFLDPYLQQLDEAEKRYPSGTAFEGKSSNGAHTFSAYYLPKADGATPPPTPEEPSAPTPTPSPAEGGGERDQTRLRDLGIIAQAFEDYRQEHGSYPDTAGQVQSVCIFPEDVGCDIKDTLDPVPQDPRGDPTINGYWFASTATEFTVYAQRESDEVPPCADHPAHLGAFDSLICVKSGAAGGR